MSLVNHGKGKCNNVPKIYYYDTYGSVSDQCNVPCLPPDCDVTVDFIWDSPVWYVSGRFSNKWCSFSIKMGPVNRKPRVIRYRFEN